MATVDMDNAFDMDYALDANHKNGKQQFTKSKRYLFAKFQHIFLLHRLSKANEMPKSLCDNLLKD